MSRSFEIPQFFKNIYSNNNRDINLKRKSFLKKELFKKNFKEFFNMFIIKTFSLPHSNLLVKKVLVNGIFNREKNF